MLYKNASLKFAWPTPKSLPRHSCMFTTTTNTSNDAGVTVLAHALTITRLGNGVQLCGSATRRSLFSFEKDPRKILMVKDHARERNKPFYAKTKVSAFTNFEVGRLIKKKKKKKSAV